MATIKAKAEITIFNVKDVKSVTRYYLLQSSTASAPAKPTANPPGGNWVTTEPSYTSGSTNTLYLVDQTILSDGSVSYSDVSKSSSYEAAKAAYNKALSVEKSGNELKLFWEKLINVDEADPDNYEKYITFKDGNIIVGIDGLKQQLVIGSDGIYITNGSSISLAKSGVVQLGKHTIIGDNSGESSLHVIGNAIASIFKVIDSITASTWLTARDNAVFNAGDKILDNDYYPLISLPTLNSTWAVATYNNLYGNALAFTRTTDSDYSAGTNRKTGNSSYLDSGIGMALDGTGTSGAITVNTTNASDITNRNLRRIGNVVQMYMSCKVKKSYAVGRTGTVSVASVPAGFRPVSIVAVSSGQQGPPVTGIVGPDGNICMMGTAVKLAANDEISLSGTWLTGDKLTS
jgi:hypothetical protein